jgi:hypothetical protein
MNEKTELIIKIISVLILIALNIAVYINGINLSCDKCQIRFNYEYLEENKFFYANISSLYEGYINNECYVEADEMGFTMKNDIQD